MSTTHAKAAKAFLSDKVNAEWHDKTLYMVRAKRDRLSHAIPEWEELRHTARDLKLYSNSHLPELIEECERCRRVLLYHRGNPSQPRCTQVGKE